MVKSAYRCPCRGLFVSTPSASRLPDMAEHEAFSRGPHHSTLERFWDINLPKLEQYATACPGRGHGRMKGEVGCLFAVYYVRVLQTACQRN